MDAHLDYNPNKGQEEFHRSTAKIKCMVGSLGSGKTSTGCVEGVALSLQYGGNRGLIARKKLTDLKMTTLKTFFAYCPDVVIHSWNKVDRELKLKSKDGTISEIYFGPLDDIDRYKSMDLGWFFIDEANECPQDIFMMLMGRLRVFHKYPDGRIMRQCGMLATNPTTTRHWIYKTFVESPSIDTALFRSKTKDNEKHLPPGYIDMLVRNSSRDWAKRYIEGEFGLVQEGEPVFPDFLIEKHVQKLQPIKGQPILRGWDFGKRGQFVVWCQFDDLGRFRILDCILKEMDMDQFAPLVVNRTQKEYWGYEIKDFCDPSGANNRDSALTYVQMLNNKNIWPHYRFSKPSDRHPEFRRLMRNRISGQEAFLIDPTGNAGSSNEYLIEGLIGGYCFKKNTDVFEEKVDTNNYHKHGIDGVGYILVNTSLADTPQQRDIQNIEIARPKWTFGRKRGLIV